MKSLLNVKTAYTFMRSIIRANDYVNFGVEKGLDALVICDINMHGVPEFYNLCIKNKIKPIIGLRIMTASDDILVFAKNNKGLKDLYRLSTIQSEEVISLEQINRIYANLIFVVSSEHFNELDKVKNKHLLQEKRCVAYIREDEQEYFECMLKIGETEYNREISMEVAINDAPVYDFITEIQVTLEKQIPKIPSINEEREEHNINYFRQLSLGGLKRRLGTEELPQEYATRLKYECETIIRMGYVNYFLIVYDYVLYAKKNDILVGPGRGSAAGSLVAYSLGIIDIDPLKYGLIFERFLNPERISMPDIDLDFPCDERANVINYIMNKYGKDKVANIVTFGTFRAKQIMRDVARAMGVDMVTINSVAKLMRGTKTLQENLDNIKLKMKINSSLALKKCAEIALKLEGLPRHSSTHAAGIVISSEPLLNKIPLVHHEIGYLTGYSMDYLEELGLLKMDILAIRNLTLIDNILKQVNLKFNEIPLDDKRTLLLFSKGLTEGIFQFEASGMKKFLQSLRPTTFEDIIAATALYRPGPMQYIDSFAKRKNNLEVVTYLHKDLEPILESTYGIIVYQEQIMEIAVRIAGMRMAEADILRKGVSKRNESILAEMRDDFINGGLNKGYSNELLNEIFAMILKFANYGFPKAHAASYATVSYKMAYLKCHYKELFMSELLNINLGSEYKINEYLGEAKLLSLTVVPPNINLSSERFEVKDNTLVYPLSGIKGIAGKNTKIILEERANGDYRDFTDFVVRTYALGIKEQVIINLIKVGAFTCLEANKKSLIESLDAVVNYANLVTTVDANYVLKPEPMEVEEYLEKELLSFEKELLGLYLTNHPVIKYKNEQFIIDLNDLNNHLGKTVKVVGMVGKIKEITTKKGDKMAFVTINDESGVVSLTFFPTQYARANFEKQDIIKVIGNAEVRNHDVQIVVNQYEVLD